jgi:hypothetical protein
LRRRATTAAGLELEAAGSIVRVGTESVPRKRGLAALSAADRAAAADFL